MPWKNGLGSTLQIAVDQNNLWRLSAATVLQPSPFSDYTGYDRLLMVWRGDGLLLNDYLLQKNEVYSFAGEDTILCKNLSPEVTDLGLVFQRNQVRAEMSLEVSSENRVVNLLQGINFIFCLEGELKIENHQLSEGDTLRIDTENSLGLSIHSNASKWVMIHIEIF